MKIQKQIISKESKSQIEFIDLTHDIEDVLTASGVKCGQVCVFSPHATASIAINENESLLLQDFQRLLYRLVPIDERYSHDLFELKRTVRSDGRSNGHSHCKDFLVGVSETIPVEDGKMLLGEHQNIFLVEMDGARKRDVIVQIIGE
ncbi:MAG TPA: secondary thiamine-phosphate synthase enzyme YjbQ [Candidatus Bathyarchaeia archaeon]|nr:secondary thiamine-phosphate synthase enzyme YjbQ [Candidatus Bathyarchaeia archaeon]